MKAKRCWAVVAVRAACSLLLFPFFAHGADPAVKRLRIVALDSLAQIAIVKLDDENPRVWRTGEILSLSAQRARLRECAGNRAIVEITAQSGVQPKTLLIAAGATYRFDSDFNAPSIVSPASARSSTRL